MYKTCISVPVPKSSQTKVGTVKISGITAMHPSAEIASQLLNMPSTIKLMLLSKSICVKYLALCVSF